MSCSRLGFLPLLLILLIGIPFAQRTAADDPDAEQLYRDRIQPLLQEKCVPCHGALRAEAGLRLDAGALIRDSGIIDLEHPSSSEMIERVSANDAQRMPPAGEAVRLSQSQVRLLLDWIQSGAKSPHDEIIPVGPDKHWAYQRIQRPVVPSALSDTKTDHPIDAFLNERRRIAGIHAGPPASRSLLVRRIYLDVIGLPPTPDQQTAFVSGTQSWGELVDSLISHPAYGQRWGRHWMDVWRYSDWDGFKQQLRGSQRHIWRWRDWIIESLNDDKPYDQMIREMLAGDEIAPLDPQTWRATGFLARNYHNKNRNIWLDATVEHTSKAFLAMTLNCARCHDHKYDPLSQPDYFKMRAVFEPYHVRTERIRGQADLTKDGIARVYDQDLDAKTFLFLAGDEKRPDETNPLQPAVPEILRLAFQPKPVVLPLRASIPDLRPFVEAEEIASAKRAVEEAIAKEDNSRNQRTSKERRIAELRLASIQARWQADRASHEHQAEPGAVDPNESQWSALRTVAVKAEHAWSVAKAKADLQHKIEAQSKAETDEATQDEERSAAIKKAKAAVKSADKKLRKLRSSEPSDYTSVVTTYPRQSTGRRTALAQWMTHPDNPLTARVAVNHIWLRHFGKPLVENVFDFGLRSPRPKHDQLLDWLAAELIDSRWSMKHLHRLMLTSQLYQMAPAADHPAAPAQRALDPDNEFYWHANPRRLEAEIVRDAILHVAGNLDLTHGGPEIDFQKGETEMRRSVYFRHAYEKQMTMLVTFDAASPTDCYRRSSSVIPQQALALSNSPLTITQSRVLARRLIAHSESDRRFIEKAFTAVLARIPTRDEIETCEQFLTAQTDRLQQPSPTIGGAATASVPPSKDPSERAKENLVHVLMNHNDFVTVR